MNHNLEVNEYSTHTFGQYPDGIPEGSFVDMRNIHTWNGPTESLKSVDVRIWMGLGCDKYTSVQTIAIFKIKKIKQ